LGNENLLHGTMKKRATVKQRHLNAPRFPRATEERVGLLDRRFLCQLAHAYSRNVERNGTGQGQSARIPFPAGVAEWTGHRTIQMTMRCAHLAPEHSQPAVEEQVSLQEEVVTERVTTTLAGIGANAEVTASKSRIKT
jgi:hypothetical protein